MARRSRPVAWFAVASIALALCAGIARNAHAQTWPDRAITIVNPASAGGIYETLKNILFEPLAVAIGKPIVFDARGGGGGAVGATIAAKAEPDGYTLLIAGTSVLASNPATQPGLSYDPIRDFTPIVILVEAPLLLVATRSAPASSAREFVDLLRRRPGQLNYGSYGPGTSNFLAFELLKNVTGTDALHVPYRGSAPLLVALLSGEVQAAFDFHTIIRPHVESGALRILGVAGASRFPPLSTVPTLREQGIDVEATGIVALVAPAGTPSDIVDRLNHELNKVLADPAVGQRIAQTGFVVVGGTREQASQRIASEFAKWSRLVRDIGYRPN